MRKVAPSPLISPRTQRWRELQELNEPEEEEAPDRNGVIDSLEEVEEEEQRDETAAVPAFEPALAPDEGAAEPSVCRSPSVAAFHEAEAVLFWENHRLVGVLRAWRAMVRLPSALTLGIGSAKLVMPLRKPRLHVIFRGTCRLRLG
jgi:hypothetical protein